MYKFFELLYIISTVIYLISSRAYLLVFHGSRDSRTLTAASELKHLLLTKFRFKNILTQQNYLKANLLDSEDASDTVSLLKPRVDIAALELGSKSLSESLLDFARQVHSSGIKQINVIPLFLAPGIHVKQDIPSEIDLALKQLDRSITIELSSYLGNYSGIASLLSDKFSQLSGEARILVAHGSRLSMADSYYQDLATKLDADLAYWSVAPKMASVVKAQIDSGKKKIAILPYFLFPGRITRAIASEVAQLQKQYPQVELNLGEPLGATEALAKLIAESI